MVDGGSLDVVAWRKTKRTAHRHAEQILRRPDQMRKLASVFTITQISDFLGITPQRVSNTLKGRVPTVALADVTPLRNRSWLRARYIDEGLTATQIADMVDQSPSTVNYWLRRHQLSRRQLSDATTAPTTPSRTESPRRNGERQERRDAAEILANPEQMRVLRAVFTMYDIADVLGVGRQRTRAAIERHGLLPTPADPASRPRPNWQRPRIIDPPLS